MKVLHDLVPIEGREFSMGSVGFYPEEAPVRRVRVAQFLMDRTPVTNRQFKAFVEATSYVTVAERIPDALMFPDADPAVLVPGSLLFVGTSDPVDLEDPSVWWSYCPDANWRNPRGRGSTLDGLSDHPVVHVAYEDAVAYADWVGLRLPSETEWEFAARGGLDGATYAWGDELAPAGRYLANTWQGSFPWLNSMEDGFAGTSPVGIFPPNGYGLLDMIGNVWEWTSTVWTRAEEAGDSHPCCAPTESRTVPEDTIGGRIEGPETSARVLKGGSHLCAPNYCKRYRPAARTPGAEDTSTSHIGFRCAR